MDLRLGDWASALEDIAAADALICDPPYSARTHAKQTHGRKGEGGDWLNSRGLTYQAWGARDVCGFVDAWAPKVRGWICLLTDSEIYPIWRDRLRQHDRTVFAPIPCVMPGANVRLAGDGPSSWSVWLIVARPKVDPYRRWGTLPGAYIGQPGFRESKTPIAGTKPVWLMSAIVRDYSKPGDLIVDPCAGTGTTLIAAETNGRRSVGSEVDPETYRFARGRLDRGITRDLFATT